MPILENIRLNPYFDHFIRHLPKVAMNLTQKLFSKLTLFSLMALTACGMSERNQRMFEQKRQTNQHYQAVVPFSNTKVVSLPTGVENVTKRGFGDFNGDGIVDMLEIDRSFWKGGKISVRVFYRFLDKKSNLIKFNPTPKKISLKFKLGWFSSATKIDIADVNGDGFADIVFSQYYRRFMKDRLHFGFALNHKGQYFTEEKIKLGYTERSFGEEMVIRINKAIEAYELDENEEMDSFSDLIKMDWADIDGNGSDDFVIIYNSRGMEVIYTKKSSNGIVLGEEAKLGVTEKGESDFLMWAGIKGTDWADINGDGKADLLTYRVFGRENMYLGVALNQGKSLEPHHEIALKVFKHNSTFKFFKYDTFDANGDGKADFIKIAHQGTKPSMGICVNQLK
ncbi:hypothetical protein BKI52_20015 [marine bacterium AO1-C]|nr:hypothetical protein BKI52_20015 [marine bacterium AO1-C]